MIAKLEREKVILVKEMFQAKANNHSFLSEETTLIWREFSRFGNWCFFPWAKFHNQCEFWAACLPVLN